MRKLIGITIVLAVVLAAPAEAQQYCASPTHSVTSVGVAAAPVPATALAGRSLIVVCNSAENAASAVLKCRQDGTNPTLGVANVGDVLGRGQCIPYSIGSGTAVACISDTASTAVTALECKGERVVPSIPASSSTASVAVTGVATAAKQDTGNTSLATIATNSTPVTFTPSGDTATIRTAKKGRVLYDSGVVASGALIDSGVLDLTAVESIEVIADNTAGTAFRDIKLIAYLDDGTTQVDSLVLRHLAWGGAPTGGQYANGAAHGYVGPAALGGISGVHLLYYSGAVTNTAIDSGILITEECDQLFGGAGIQVGGTTTGLTINGLNDDGLNTLNGANSGATVSTNMMWSWGPGLPNASPPGSAAGYFMMTGHVVPRRMNLTLGAAGAGKTGFVTVYCRGRTPGTFSVPMVLPTKAKLQLTAAGAANGRLTVLGR